MEAVLSTFGRRHEGEKSSTVERDSLKKGIPGSTTSPRAKRGVTDAVALKMAAKVVNAARRSMAKERLSECHCQDYKMHKGPSSATKVPGSVVRLDTR